MVVPQLERPDCHGQGTGKDRCGLSRRTVPASADNIVAGPILEALVAKHSHALITALKLGSKLKQLFIDLVNRSKYAALRQ